MESNPQPMIDVKAHAVFNFEPFETPGDPRRYVYHYTRWERLLDIMQAGFRLGALTAMNDPRESKDWNLPTATQEPGPMVDQGAVNRTVASYRRKIRLGAFCIDQPYGAADNQGRRGYARPRMWAQYAENHKGVCVVMSRAGLNEAIRARYPDHDGSWVHDGSVKYVETAQEDPSTRFVNFLGQANDIELTVRDYFYELRESMFFVKHADWRDENEYRWVYYDADESGTGVDGFKKPFVNIKNNVVAALVLGADYADSHLPVARMFAEAHGLAGDVVRCRWDRLNLNLVPFAEDGDDWIPVDSGARALHLRIGIPRPKNSSPEA
jgi:hypothetical protein